MPIEIQDRIEGKRGCGYRKPGGIYLIGPPLGSSCCKLPFPLDICPCCGAGVKPTRGWTWVNPDKLLWPTGYDEYHDKCLNNDWGRTCPMSRPGLIGEKAGLLWIGEQFYATPEDFLHEAARMGISRRLSSVPKDFKLGETWVLMAHRKGLPYEADIEGGLIEKGGIQLTKTEYKPAIFSIFKPTALEYVTKGDETEEDLEALDKRGLTPVKVINKVPYRV